MEGNVSSIPTLRGRIVRCAGAGERNDEAHDAVLSEAANNGNQFIPPVAKDGGGWRKMLIFATIILFLYNLNLSNHNRIYLNNQLMVNHQ